MKVLFYSPYLNILGGGEYHLLQFVSCLSRHDQAYLVWSDPDIIKQAQARFGLDLTNVAVIPYLPPRFHLREFELLFFVSDGSIPFLPVSKSVLFFMSPFRRVHGRSLINQIKLKFINYVICNSYYTKKFIDHEFNIESNVIYPAVNLPLSVPKSKQDIILSVGRFSRSLHDKNQLALIRSFIDLEPQLPGWKLILAGGTEKGSQTILDSLHRQTAGHRIAIKTDISPRKLNQLYAQAKIYWHAAGFGSDLKNHPEKAEHFGISIVEAMSYGCVPLVFNAGGPTEIIIPGSGVTWDKLSELEQQTLALINNPETLANFSAAARNQAADFSQDTLCQKFHSLLH